ncbi:hypothetical protein ASPFODRAFT_44720, partial [Aspergillus luchuensis CBS 106.47]
MATGLEAAGVVLALLPLLVHQIGSYVEGLQMLNRLKWEVYRSWMERNVDLAIRLAIPLPNSGKARRYGT